MTDGTHAMRGCEPCQGRKAAAISIVSCVPWEFSAPSILRLRMDSADESRRFFFYIFYLTAEGRRIQRELHMSYIEKLHTHHMYVTKARKRSKNRTLSKFRGGGKTQKGLKCRIIGHIIKWNSWAIQAERWKQNKGWRICGSKGYMQSFCLSCS